MKIKDLMELSNFKLISDRTGLEHDITGIFCSDLLSHVMGHAGEGNILITMLNNINVLGVASLLDLSGVIFSHSIKVNEQVVLKANELGITLLSTALSTAETVIVLHELGV